VLDLILIPLGGYLIGSISGSLVLGKLRGIDIRAMGSGNAGGTNALRTVGWQFALAVVIIDVGKGAVAAGLLPLLAVWLSETPATPVTLGVLAGFAAVVGHIWPVYFRFRGGKGAGTAVGVLAVLAPWCIAPLLLMWVIAIIGTGYVGLATVLASLSVVPAMWLLGPKPLPLALGGLAIALAVLLTFAHRSNLLRLKAGTENRFEKARLLKRR
jgi:acyl phosphate:glycerol-3-phosphate acyltransferase